MFDIYSSDSPSTLLKSNSFSFHLDFWKGEKGPQNWKSESHSYWGYVTEGGVVLNTGDFSSGPLGAGMYFSCPEELRLSGEGRVMILTIPLIIPFSVGGPIGKAGWLKYINGASDSLLIFPPRKGLPCLNAMWLPKHTTQTFHTHPDARVGLVVAGTGTCDLEGISVPFKPNDVFYLTRDTLHRFRSKEEEIQIITFHPHSSWGPEDDNHPLINHTFL
jgi:mannose-6-phosphate isomerase-like protein (cupin superfamily)